MKEATLPQPASPRALAVLRHPDQTISWTVVLAASLSSPLPDVDRRLAAVHEAAPLVGARLEGKTWVAGSPPTPVAVEGDPVPHQALTAHFHLESEPPLRVWTGEGGRRVALAGHHAAFDGRGLMAVLMGLLGGALPRPAVDQGLSGHTPGLPLGRLRRLIRPADRVTPSADPPTHDSFAESRTSLSGPAVTARLAAAAVVAAAAHNQSRGGPWRRVGVTLGVGGSPGAGNVASYRRVDLPPGADVVTAVDQVLRDPAEPRELHHPPRLARFAGRLAVRLSDSLLISNLGLFSLPLAHSVSVYPVARGRSAVAVGAAGLEGADSTVSLRARDLSPKDAEELLGRIVANLERSSGAPEARPPSS